MLAWCIISTILLVVALAGIMYVTTQWFRAEKKLAKFGQSTLYKRLKNNKLYKKCENFFKTHADDNK